LIACRKRVESFLFPAPAEEEFQEIVRTEIAAHWTLTLEQLGFDTKSATGNSLSYSAYLAAMKLIDVSFKSATDLSVDEWECIRDFFKSLAEGG
jgi:hypothetical protein